VCVYVCASATACGPWPPASPLPHPHVPRGATTPWGNICTTCTTWPRLPYADRKDDRLRFILVILHSLLETERDHVVLTFIMHSCPKSRARMNIPLYPLVRPCRSSKTPRGSTGKFIPTRLTRILYICLCTTCCLLPCSNPASLGTKICAMAAAPASPRRCGARHPHLARRCRAHHGPRERGAPTQSSSTAQHTAASASTSLPLRTSASTAPPL